MLDKYLDYTDENQNFFPTREVFCFYFELNLVMTLSNIYIYISMYLYLS